MTEDEMLDKIRENCAEMAAAYRSQADLMEQFPAAAANGSGVEFAMFVAQARSLANRMNGSWDEMLEDLSELVPADHRWMTGNADG